MKRILLIALAALMALSATSCGMGASNTESATIEIASVDDVKLDDYENTFDGLINYFKKIGYILCADNGASNTTQVDLNAEAIGAKQGKRFKFTYEGSTVTIELYELYTGEGATSTDALEEAKKTGTLNVFDIEKFEVHFSNNNKYMMIYLDKDNDAENASRKKSAIELFKKFDR
ncbi:MAG: hypothetical protein ACI4II_07555 [Acutalibacteraceae bacterium]